MDKLYSYAVPEELGQVSVGCRVEVQFGRRRHYGAIVADVNTENNPLIKTKSVLTILDEEPLVNSQQLELWQWIADYYLCSLGEVMIAALPSIFKLNSESVLIANENIDQADIDELTEDEYLITEALQVRQQISLEDARLILQKKNVFPVLEKLVFKNILIFKEEIKDRYRPRVEEWLHIGDDYRNLIDFDHMFDQLQRAPAQTDCLLQFFQYKEEGDKLPLRKFLAVSGCSRTHVRSLVDRGLLYIEKKQINRLLSTDIKAAAPGELDDQQRRTYAELNAIEDRKPVLIHGVTGSGKTRVYIEKIRDCLASGRQVLYLLPEIALTTQIELRLRAVFGGDIISYHSRLNPQERVDAWKLVQSGFPVVLAARSGVFLPFQDLGLIIVDESHDSSYKQQNPAPRYNGRDIAVVMGHLHEAQVILGTATPSMESLGNVQEGKYHKIEMPERHGKAILPRIELVHLQKDRPLDFKTEIFSQRMLDEIQSALSRKKQVILFQNRRGYAPLLLCSRCDWRAECVNCDVSLTVHKYRNNAQCHFCNYKIVIPESCPKCQGQLLRMSGFGTEKIVEELAEIFPSVNVERLDYETARGKKAFQEIIDRFSYGESQIMVGTQMITKGLDFDHVALVGILMADQALYFPDFRANERAYQLFMQVSGRAGRREEQGKVLIQTMRPEHPIFNWLQEDDYSSFVEAEMGQRQQFSYPPYVRLIRVSGMHVKALQAYNTTQLLIKNLQHEFGPWVTEIAPNSIPRIKNRYIYQFLIKLPKSASHSKHLRQKMQYELDVLKDQKDHRSVRFVVDVDPVF